jgi:hypothetical protein
MTLHYDLMAQLDAAQMSGKLAYRLHAVIRQNLRRAQMSGATLDSSYRGARALLRGLSVADVREARAAIRAA